MKKLIYTWVITSLLWGERLIAEPTTVVSTNNPAAAAPANLPEITLMPWREFGVLAETHTLAKPALEAASKKLAEAWIGTPKPLSDIIDKQRFSINTLNAAKLLTTGSNKNRNFDTPLLLQPLWGVIADQLIVFLQVGRADQDTLLASVHTVFSKAEWDAQKTPAAKTGFLSGKIAALSQQALSKLAAVKSAPADHALQISFSLVRENGRYDVGSYHVLNLLLAEKLAADPETLIRTVGGEGMQLLRYVLGLTATQLRRATRVVNFDWRIVQKNLKVKPSFPATFDLTMDFTESVFGKKIQTPKDAKYEFTLNQGQVAFNIDPALADFIKREQASLKLADMPKVSKVYGAWVYLDRGRAYGLKMEDRLTSGGEIAGHVVGFYGPELAINSPRGFPIEEGAIVFIRKGQDKTKIGQEFAFDKKTYPTKWPPN